MDLFAPQSFLKKKNNPPVVKASLRSKGIRHQSSGKDFGVVVIEMVRVRIKL